jgi:hypothetical protein
MIELLLTGIFLFVTLIAYILNEKLHDITIELIETKHLLQKQNIYLRDLWKSDQGLY